MGVAIGQMLPFACALALSPTPIIGMVMMLTTPRTAANGLMFFGGWFVGVVLVGAALLALSGQAEASEGGWPAAWVSWLKLLLGLLLLWLAVRQWRARPAAEDEVPLPKWMGLLQDVTPIKAGGVAVLVGPLNPKNLVLIAGGVAAVAEVGISGSETALVWLLFTLIASLGVGVPLALYLLMGDGARRTLDSLKDWMVRNNTAVMAVLCLVFGVLLVGNAIAALSA
jgi:threonine/homoserine/homoserine lactone efflux protein